MNTPRHYTGIRCPDTSHLSPEDAALLEALYLERNTVSRGELARVRNNVALARAADRAAQLTHHLEIA
jgi:hypothetical protein